MRAIRAPLVISIGLFVFLSMTVGRAFPAEGVERAPKPSAVTSPKADSIVCPNSPSWAVAKVGQRWDFRINIPVIDRYLPVLQGKTGIKGHICKTRKKDGGRIAFADRPHFKMSCRLANVYNNCKATRVTWGEDWAFIEFKLKKLTLRCNSWKDWLSLKASISSLFGCPLRNFGYWAFRKITGYDVARMERTLRLSYAVKLNRSWSSGSNDDRNFKSYADPGLNAVGYTGFGYYDSKQGKRVKGVGRKLAWTGFAWMDW